MPGIDDAIPAVVSAQLIRRLGESLIFAARTNRMYQSSAANGNKIEIVPPGEVTIGNYRIGEDIDIQRYATGDKLELTYTGQKYFAITVDDIHQRQAVPDVVMSGIEVGGAKLSEQIDADVKIAMHAGIAAANQELDIGSDSDKINLSDDTAGVLTPADAGKVKNAWVAAGREMDSHNVPQMGRWAIIGPVMRSVLNLLYSSGEVSNQLLDDTARNGFAGSLFGFNCYVTSAPNLAATPAGQELAIWGSDYGLVNVTQVSRTERYRAEKQFADVYRSLVTYGNLMIESESFYSGKLIHEGQSVFS